MQKKPTEAIYYLTSGNGTMVCFQVSLVIVYYPFVVAYGNNASHKTFWKVEHSYILISQLFIINSKINSCKSSLFSIFSPAE